VKQVDYVCNLIQGGYVIGFFFLVGPVFSLTRRIVRMMKKIGIKLSFAQIQGSELNETAASVRILYKKRG